MPRAHDERDLLASTGDVWSFVAEPHHLPDWWPGLAAVDPDRRGAAAGARWRVRRSQPGWLHRGDDSDTLLVTAAEARRRLAFELIGAGIRVDLRLEPIAADRTAAALEVEIRWLAGSPRRLAADALSRLHALCQTAANL
jgi:polyketide cyclase/dehydrase/lipid transport protein